MASSRTTSNVYLSMTFHKQSYVIITSNDHSATVQATIRIIGEVLGPFKCYACGNTSIPAYVMYSESHFPFGTKSNPAERRTVAVKLCSLFNRLYNVGWKPAGDCVMDRTKKRGSVLFKFDPQAGPSDTSFACVTVPNPSRLMTTACPTWAETSVTNCLLGAVRSGTSFPITHLEGRFIYPSVVRDYSVYSHHIKHFVSSGHKEFDHPISLVLATIRGMKAAGFDLETSFSVFGDQCDIMMFAYKTKPMRDGKNLWALTVRQPSEFKFYQCPSGLKSDALENIGRDPHFQNRLLWAKDCHAGKSAMARLIRFMELRNWQVVATVDGLYKNSFLIFGKSETNISETNYRATELPWTAGFTVASNKKMRYDDCSGMYKGADGNYHRETLFAVKAFNAIGTPPRGTTPGYESLIRVFPEGSLSYFDANSIAQQMAIYVQLVITMNTKGRGFVLCCAANVSGSEKDEDGHEYQGPHTWFFIRRPQLQTPPSFAASVGGAAASVRPSAPSPAAELHVSLPEESASPPPAFDDDGLPTYEEAMENMDKSTKEAIA